MRKFSWVAWWLLGIVTCGIYQLYVWYAMTENVNEIAIKHGLKPIMGFIPSFLLGIVTCGIYSIVWQFKFYNLQIKAAEASGIRLTPAHSSFLMFILTFVPIYSFIFITENNNRLVDAN